GGGDPAALVLPTFSDATADGGTEGGLLSNILNAGDFIRTQAAQDSQIKVDGYPANEVQTLSAVTSPATGTYTLTYDGQTTGNIAVDASNAVIQAALEGLSNVNAGDITVSGSLDAGDVKFTFASSIGDASMISIDPALLDQSGASNYSMEETAKAWISRSSNSFSGVLPGVSIELYDVGTVQISLNKDLNSLKSKLKGLVSSYNSTISFIKEKSAYDEETKKAGVLISNYTTKVVQSIMRAGIRTPAVGFTEGEEEYIYAWEIGLDFSSDQDSLGTLKLDEAKLDEAIENDYEAVAALIGAFNAGKSSGTDKNIINFTGSSQYTEVGDYEVEVDTDGAGDILQVRIKHSSETQWHYQPADTWDDNGLVTIKGRLNADSDEWYPERDLQISIDMDSLSASQTYTATIHVQQGFAGALKDRLKDILDTTVDENMVPRGYLAIDTESGKKAMEAIDDRIALEEKRLTKKEARLTAQFARLEKTMTILQQQLSSLSMLQMNS
ncbi:MAG: flagellar filament capping protein FliD, partial [Phycisphaerae bacterium]|nr:flagellar filament capping protein FliD [Phycisphaerae bacterium]